MNDKINNSIIFLITSLIIIGITFNEVNKTKSECEMKYQDKLNRYMVLYDFESLNKSITTSVNGIYYPSADFYCVYVKNRTLTEIQQTEYHEECHSYITNKNYHGYNKTHFCK